MEEQPFNIPIDEPQKEFAKHLEPKENKRIIFSAPFGTGKTYFLDKFFKAKPEKVIHLFPVNYSVSSNEDVFELIKFDILLQLLEGESIELDDNSFSTFFIAQFFLLHNADKVVEWILNRFGKVGKAVNKHAQMIERVVKAYQKFEHEMQTNADKSTAVDFLLAIKNKQGNVYESDAITNLICGLIQQYEENNQKTVLIIDDLDRIDPEHIFRLLNVFAAHFDIGALDTNKFGFDKVIFVCDINNIRNIFHSKYGTETDFTGYIDKFYSLDIFRFKNIDATVKIIEKIILNKLIYKNINSGYTLEKKRKIIYEFLSFLIVQLYTYDSLNLRSIKKIYYNTISLSNYKLQFKFHNTQLYSSQSIVVIVFEILKFVYGTYESALIALKKAVRFSNTKGIGDDGFMYDDILSSNLLGHCTPILASDYFFDKIDSSETSIKFSENQLGIMMTIRYFKDLNVRKLGFVYYDVIEIFSLDSSRPAPKNYLKLFEVTFEKLRSIGHLKD